MAKELEDCTAFVGIDWADQKHVCCAVDSKMRKPELSDLEQEPGAIDHWVGKLRQRFPKQKIAICLEQKRGALIYALMKYDCLVLVPVNPAQLSQYRESLAPSRAKNDPVDAQLLAEFVMKHLDRVKAWIPDDEQTRTIRLLAEDRRNLVNGRTALTNRLKSRLKQSFPLALQVCGDRLHGNLACQLLLRYSTLESLQSATDEELAEFYHDHKCFRKDRIRERVEAIRQATPLTTDHAIVESGRMIVRAVVMQIISLNQSIAEYDTKLESLMSRHRDAEIFQSFPGAGRAMAPRLLAAMGSNRERLASAKDIQAIAGVAPTTRESGKSRSVRRRWACNRFLLQTFHEFAAHSIKQSSWAKAYHRMMIERGNKHQAAVRALAFKWARIIFRCWKDRTQYDELAYVTTLIKRKSPIIQFIANTPHEKRAAR